MKDELVPTIDISALFGTNLQDKLKVAEKIDRACRNSGFFFASNHGVDVLDDLVKTTRKFHQSLTEQEKWDLAIVAYNKNNTTRIRNGYYLPIEGKKAVESYCYLNPSFTPDHPKIKANLPCHEVNIWPDTKKHVGFKEFNESYYWKMFDVSAAILRGFALALGKSESFFDDYFKKEDTMSSVRLIRYPYLENYPPVKTAKDGTKVSFESHVDASLLTVLYQPFVGNLQVEMPDGYKDIQSSDDCFLVNAGGYMAWITENYYRAPIHRVKWVNAERLSLPYFVMLGYDSTIQPFVPNDPNEKPRNAALSYGNYFTKARVDLVVSNVHHTMKSVNGNDASCDDLLQPYTHSEEINLSCIPTHRLRLGNYPTPLQPWKFSWKNQHYQLWIKRDDLTDMAASGNKLRKLEFILPEVMTGNYDCILSLGPCQSNSCRVLSAIAPRLGMKSAHVLVKTSAKEIRFTEGNLFFHNLFGSELFFVSREEYRAKGQDAILKETSDKLIESKMATNPYILPMGGSTIQGVLGYLEAFKEIEDQILNGDLEIDEIIFACGSGGTAAGLCVGKYLSKTLRNVRLRGYIAWDSGVDYFYKYVNDALGQLGLMTKVKAQDLITFVEAYNKGYGESTEDELDLIRSVARSSGIVLDGTYTVKALRSYLQTEKDTDNIFKCLFLHTGGMFSLMGRNEYLENVP